MTPTGDQPLQPGRDLAPSTAGQLAPWAVPPPRPATPPSPATPPPPPAAQPADPWTALADHPAPSTDDHVTPGPLDQVLADQPGEAPAPPPEKSRRRLPRVPWRRFAAAGLVLLALGLLGGGFVVGWASHSALGSTPDGNTTVEVVEAPDGAAAIEAALPDVRGLPVVDARQAIADLGLSADAITAVDAPSAQAEGTVVRQDPIGGTTDASTVTLYVAVPGEVPALVGRTSDDADRALTDLGVRVERKQIYDPTVAEGTVTALDPPPGSPLPLTVTVTVAGPASSLYLQELEAVEGGCYAEATSINGQDHEHSLTCSSSSYSSDEQVTTYLVDRLATSVEGVIGITDESDPGLVVAVTMVGDGRALWSGTLRYGQSTPFAADTRGVLRFEIRYRTTSEEASGSFALGDARAVGSPADITTLGAE